ncbi:Prp18 domain-containing protein [Geopyxis carbonaria]|nr:Prp18 domain-containing protein [Geopyxis carbonaria]
MDFASILSSEISKKRKAPASTTTTAAAEPKKYLKRSELEAQRAAQYLAEQKALDAARAARAAEKRAADEADAARREAVREKQRKLAEEAKRREDERLGRTKAAPEAAAAEAEDTMDDAEAIARLRALGAPAKLFGESHAARVRRVKRLEGRKATATAAEEGELPPLAEEEMQLVPGEEQTNPEKVYRQLDQWFKLVMREWKTALEARPLQVKESIQGRKAADAMRQADEYMRPLFAHFKNRDLRAKVFEKVCEIVVQAQARQYVKANDVYLRLSIGNAAWPIGVTMVGIHERSAREKLHEHGREGAAHIMSDEVTRKFLQSIKRCLSFCQTRWPPEDPLQLMG